MRLRIYTFMHSWSSSSSSVFYHLFPPFPFFRLFIQSSIHTLIRLFIWYPQEFQWHGMTPGIKCTVFHFTLSITSVIFLQITKKLITNIRTFQVNTSSCIVVENYQSQTVYCLRSWTKDFAITFKEKNYIM